MANLSWGQTLLIAALVAAVTAGVMSFTGGQEQAAVTPTEDLNGEFDQVGLSSSQYESPFTSRNGFETINVDNTPSDGTSEVLDLGNQTWQVANNTDLGLKERRAAVFFETDGPMGDVDIDLKDQRSGTAYESNVSVTSGSTVLYDYELATDEDSIENTEVLDSDGFEVDGFAISTDKEIETLSEGEYIFETNYQFDSGEDSYVSSTPQTDVIHELEIDAGDAGDVDTVDGFDIIVETVN